MQYDVIFAYLRLSRDDKEKIEESNSIKNQKLLIQHFVDNQPEFAGARLLFFADDGYSGTTFERPEFQRMLGLITRKKRICIIVKDLSRLGRDTIETQNYIEKYFHFLGYALFQSMIFTTAARNLRKEKIRRLSLRT